MEPETPSENTTMEQPTKQPETPVEVTEQKPKEKPFVVVVQETDLVSLIPKAEDPDKGTTLAYTFTSPVSDKGESSSRRP